MERSAIRGNLAAGNTRITLRSIRATSNIDSIRAGERRACQWNMSWRDVGYPTFCARQRFRLRFNLENPVRLRFMTSAAKIGGVGRT
jgi:hypothetical protein